MKLKVLGTQSPYNTPNHHCPGFLITEGQINIMLDCGSGSHSVLNFPHDLQNLSVILSHLHRDHYNDIYNLQYASFVFHNQKRIERPISIYMPKTPSRISTDIMSEKDSFARYRFINEKTSLKLGKMHLYFCQTDHPVETYAIKVCSGDKTIVYTSDTSFSAKSKLAEFAQGADLLICESSLLKEHGFPEINSHLTAYQAGVIAKEAQVKGLLLTHFWPEESVQKYVLEAKKIFPRVASAKEGQIIDLPIAKEYRKEDMR